MLYCSLIYTLSMLYVALTIKVKVGIPESFKVGWYPHRITGSSHLTANILPSYTMLPSCIPQSLFHKCVLHRHCADDNTQVSLSLHLPFSSEVARERHARGARSIRKRSRESKGWGRFSPGRMWFSPFLSSSLLCHSLARSLAVCFLSRWKL